ncbi:hypothetical protein ACEPPN_010941 [Leptodophora sp. 'Broadleaf-Isolate-01']
MSHSALKSQSDVDNSPHAVSIAEEPIFTPRNLRVVCIGAGFSGLVVSHKYNHVGNFKDHIDLAIYEKNSDVGGTWLENRYPGIACDVPAHIYTFLFEPNPDWTSFFATGPEIWRYIKRTSDKYDLARQVQFNSRLVESVWDQDKGKWRLKIDQSGTIIEDEADILINSSGILNKWHWPKIPDLDKFQGKLVHTARWDESLSWDGKRVAIIGNGSSAVQLLPKMQPTASHITTYIRSSTWISANYTAHLTRDGHNFSYSDDEKREFHEDKEKFYQYRRNIEHEFNKFFYALLKDSPEQNAAQELFRAEMTRRLNNDPYLCEKLIPKWHVGCRRLTPGDNYLEALQEKNVDIDFADITRFTPKGILTADGEKEFDIIVCATGFDVSFKPFWKMVGKDGASLNEQWKDTAEAYMSMCAPNMPNYFIFNGPNCPIGHGSLMGVLDVMSDYVFRWCSKISAQNIKSVTVNSDVVREFNTYSQELLQRTVWTSRCRSWYKNDETNGPVTAMYAGSVIHFRDFLEAFRTEDFDIDYLTANRFHFMGNGLSKREVEGGDLGFYVRK